MPTPTLSRASNQKRASDASVRVRRERAVARQQVLAGEMTVAGLFRDLPSVVHGMRAFEVIELGWYRQRQGGGCRRHLEALAIAAAAEKVNLFREIQRLTPRQREWLAGWLEEHPYRPYHTSPAAYLNT